MRKAVKIEQSEIRATLTSFALVFTLMAAYYILRPVRDAMASDWSDAEVATLWTINFFFSAIAVAVYGTAVSRVRFQRLVPSVYGFFAFTFVGFYLGSQMFSDRTLLDQSFYVWVSVFSLFHVSVFWSFMSDLFSKAQAPRLFGFIGAGASSGAIFGPAIATLFVGTLGTDNLVLMATALLICTIPIVVGLQNLKTNNLHNGGIQVAGDNLVFIGGNPLKGFLDFCTSPYLLAIGLFIFLYTFISSFIYFELKNLLADYSRAERSQIWAGMDLAVNSLTFVIAIFVTGRMATRFGLSITLASVPVIIMGGMLTIAAVPAIAVVAGLQVVRRAGNYAITRPGREMLFTAVNRETRFKTKPVIDIVVYRGGDTIAGWMFTWLSTGIGLGLGAIALTGAVVAALWASVGYYLGKRFARDNPASEGFGDAR